MAAILAGWMVLYLTVLSGAVQAHRQASLYSGFREELANATAPLGGVVEHGSPVALLDFPAVGAGSLVVVEGTTSGDTAAGPGHRPDTVLPGQEGVSVIYGRQFAYGGPFGRLADARPGSTFSVLTGQGTFVYRVDRVRRAGDPLPAPLAVGASRVTLVSAQPSPGFLGRWVPGSVVYLDATLQGKSAPRQAQAAAVPTAEQVMQGDPSVLPVVLLWLQGLILAIAAGIWAWYRWGRPQTWIAAGGIALAMLWGLSGAATGLLPNLL